MVDLLRAWDFGVVTAPQSPASKLSVIGNLVAWGDTEGQLLADAGIAAASLVVSADIASMVTASSAFGTDNVLLRSDDTGRGAQSTGITVDDSDNVTVPGMLYFSTINIGIENTARALYVRASDSTGNPPFVNIDCIESGAASNAIIRFGRISTGLSSLTVAIYDPGTNTKTWEVDAGTGNQQMDGTLSVDGGYVGLSADTDLLELTSGDLKVNGTFHATSQIYGAGAIIATDSITSGQDIFATQGLGFQAGAGGTVVQSTSKSTGVTLNAPCGQITMHNANLGSGSEVSFVLTNNFIAAADIVVVGIKSGATAGAYNVQVSATAAGSCTISLSNLSGGVLGEAVVLNFAVLTGATS